MSENNRSYPRLDYDCPAQCSFLDSFPETFPVKIIDIGPEGVGFICDQQLKIGDSIFVIVDLGVEENVKFITKVRWVQGIADTTQFKIGAKISDTSNEDLEKLIRFYCRCLVPGQVQRKKVLIIDADKEKTEQIRLELDKYKYDVICAFDGEDGFSKYVTERPDLIILDIKPPKLSGYEICRKIRRLQNDKDVLIFVLIAKEKDQAKIEGHGMGVQKFFLKSVGAAELVNEAHETLLMSEKDQTL